jgi:hypothetical protein
VIALVLEGPDDAAEIVVPGGNPVTGPLTARERQVLPADDLAAQWDGHTTAEKYERIRDHVAQLKAGKAPAACGAVVDLGETFGITDGITATCTKAPHLPADPWHEDLEQHGLMWRLHEDAPSASDGAACVSP